MLSNKEDIFWVSKMLGHKNPNITLEKYSKYIKSNRTKKITFMDKENYVFVQNWHSSIIRYRLYRNPQIIYNNK